MNRSNYRDAFKESYDNILRDQDILPINKNKKEDSPFPNFPLIEVSNFCKIETETLFIIFYYQQNDFERYVAMREIKNRGWRFHKKFQMWFKRNSEPKEITDEFEKGDILMFDSVESWNVKILKDFLCEYKFME